LREKRNFWIKLNEHFFDDPRIEYLLGVRGGESAVLVYLKLLLRGMNTGGQVFFFSDRRCDEKFIASVLGITTQKLRKCVELLRDMELLECMEDGSYFLPELPGMLGSGSPSAVRMRRMREKRAQDGVTCDGKSDGGCDTDIDKDKEINKEIEPDTDSDTDTQPDRESGPGPSFAELLAICKAKKYRVDIKEFMDYYGAMGWKKGDVPITDWNVQLRLWDYSKRLREKDDTAMSGIG